MSVTMIRAQVKDESVAEVESAAKAMFAAINEAQPPGVRYASCKLGDDATFVVLLAVEDGIENPLLALPAVREFQQNLPRWLAQPATPEPLTVVGSYNLF
jgi:hypothetical protein